MLILSFHFPSSSTGSRLASVTEPPAKAARGRRVTRAPRSAAESSARTVKRLLRRVFGGGAPIGDGVLVGERTQRMCARYHHRAHVAGRGGPRHGEPRDHHDRTPARRAALSWRRCLLR